MKEIMLRRTKEFALNCWILCDKLPKSRGYNAYVNQLIRCSSSVGANYRASQRAKSNADFINKLKIVEEEADESQYFLELILSVSKIDNMNLETQISPLIKESGEFVAIIVAAIKSTRNNNS